MPLPEVVRPKSRQWRSSDRTEFSLDTQLAHRVVLSIDPSESTTGLSIPLEHTDLMVLAHEVLLVIDPVLRDTLMQLMGYQKMED